MQWKVFYLTVGTSAAQPSTAAKQISVCMCAVCARTSAWVLEVASL